MNKKVNESTVNFLKKIKKYNLYIRYIQVSDFTVWELCAVKEFKDGKVVLELKHEKDNTNRKTVRLDLLTERFKPLIRH